MNNILSYITLAFSLIGSISAIQAVIAAGKSGVAITGAGIVAAITPALETIQTVLPHVTIPATLLDDAAQAVADVLNTYFAKPVPSPVTTAATFGGKVA